MHDADTSKNIISWYKDVFGISALVATTLYNVHMLKDKETLAELDKNTVNNICWLIH